MHDSSTQPDRAPGAGTRMLWFWGVAALVVGVVAVTSDSLWIDEALTANEVSHASFRGLWQALLQEKASDLQMPLYIFHLWLWVKIFGTSEWALRAINIPWFAAGTIIFLAAFKGRGRRALGLVVLFSPFAWYFLNEARPYTLQVSASLMAFAALSRIFGGGGLSRREESVWVAIGCFALVWLSGSSMLGMIWAGAFVLAGLVLNSRERLGELVHSHRLVMGVTFVLLLALGTYYAWTMHIGARATTGITDFRNVFFIGYELLGFGGLGPGRLAIRNAEVEAFYPYAAALAVYGAIVIYILSRGIAATWRSRGTQRLLVLTAGAAFPLVVLLVVGRTLQFRVLERHCAPLVVVILYVLGTGLGEAWRSGRMVAWLGCAFIALIVASCLEIRFAPRQKKDDYRAAAGYAKDALARGEVVWWDASPQGAIYYGVRLAGNSEDKGRAVLVVNASRETLSTLLAPDVVIESKPDIFDTGGSVTEFLRKGPYEMGEGLRAFSIWRRKPGPP